MELIYKNNYGAIYRINNASNPNYKLQMIIDTVGIFLTENDIANLLKIIRNSNEPCTCEECNGNQCNKIWTTSPWVDICLKINNEISDLMEDLILGTQFMLNMNATLEEHRIK